MEWQATIERPMLAAPRAVDVGDYEMPHLETLQEETQLEWWLQSNEPQRPPPRVVDVGLFVHVDLAGTLQEETQLEWWRQTNEPVRQAPRPVDAGFFLNPHLETLQTDTQLQWWRQTNEPVRQAPRFVESFFVLGFENEAAGGPGYYAGVRAPNPQAARALRGGIRPFGRTVRPVDAPIRPFNPMNHRE
jgi:hypothetical protein